MSHIFISYSHKNNNYAHKLAELLEILGYMVWIDGRIDYGTAWPRVIQEKLDSCVALVVIMTPQSYESDWVQSELARAKRKRKHIFPLLLEGDEPWLSVEATQFVDVRDGNLPPARFLKDLERVAPRKSNQGNDITDSPSVKQASVGITGDLEAKLIRKVDKVQPQSAENSLPDVSALTAATLSILPPPFDWCPIPAGKVTIEYSYDPQKTFDVPAFLTAKYPITNAQYEAFVDAKDGYRDSRWWDYSDHAQSWRKNNPKPIDTAFSGDDLPRTNISWYESIAFTRWLSSRVIAALPLALTRMRRGQGGEVNITLPTEQQWQRAAQGDDNCIYPWGNEFDPTRCNIDEIGTGKPTPVTQYPAGASSFGVFDLSGNVWEWCLTTQHGDSIELTGNSARVVRGGSWGNDWVNARAASRSGTHSGARDYGLGFRVVCRPPSP